jgi:hypothetical protein
VNADTGELQALRDQVAEYEEHNRLLILTIAHLTAGKPGLQQQAAASARSRLRVIRGGRR